MFPNAAPIWVLCETITNLKTEELFFELALRTHPTEVVKPLPASLSNFGYGGLSFITLKIYSS